VDVYIKEKTVLIERDGIFSIVIKTGLRGFEKKFDSQMIEHLGGISYNLNVYYTVYTISQEREYTLPRHESPRALSIPIPLIMSNVTITITPTSNNLTVIE
jgi:hypothetical protein